GRVEERKRLAVDLLLEDREIRSQRVGVELRTGGHSHSQMVTSAFTSTSNRPSAHCRSHEGKLPHPRSTTAGTRGKGLARRTYGTRVRRGLRRREDPCPGPQQGEGAAARSEEHTSELQSRG